MLFVILQLPGTTEVMVKFYYVLLRKDDGVKEFEKKVLICILKNPVKHYLQSCSEIHKIFKFLQYSLE